MLLTCAVAVAFKVALQCHEIFWHFFYEYNPPRPLINGAIMVLLKDSFSRKKSRNK